MRLFNLFPDTQCKYCCSHRRPSAYRLGNWSFIAQIVKWFVFQWKKSMQAKFSCPMVTTLRLSFLSKLRISKQTSPDWFERAWHLLPPYADEQRQDKVVKKCEPKTGFMSHLSISQCNPRGDNHQIWVVCLVADVIYEGSSYSHKLPFCGIKPHLRQVTSIALDYWPISINHCSIFMAMSDPHRFTGAPVCHHMGGSSQ